jgi:N-acetyl-anhydromuramyl-L-alanine amidase AmpD
MQTPETSADSSPEVAEQRSATRQRGTATASDNQQRSKLSMNESVAYMIEGSEQEALLWLQEALYGEAAEQENVLDWIKGIGSGAAQGAATGLAAGPWGALIGGLVGAGLGAVQTATQQQPAAAPRPAPAPRPTPPPPAARPPATPPALPPARPQPAAPPIDPQLLQQVAQLLPQLIQLLSRQSPGGGREAIEGDLLPDEAFLSEQGGAIVESGIEGPIPDVWEYLPESALPEYSQATRFVPAAAGNYRVWHESTPRPVRRIVIHITDGGANINGTISWFQNPAARVSSHYIVGQDGEVVQMVRHNDVAWHAGNANGDSIGIEHVANTRGLNPTDIQYCSSAALVNWLCTQYGIPMDRVHIVGHADADPNTTHRACPNAVWNWDYYMRMVTSGTCLPQSAMREDAETPEAATESTPLQRLRQSEVVLGYPSEWATEALMTDFSPLVY